MNASRSIHGAPGWSYVTGRGYLGIPYAVVGNGVTPSVTFVGVTRRQAVRRAITFAFDSTYPYTRSAS